MARGDQIYVMREFLNLQGVYEHHGIDCGDGTVIHYQKLDVATISRTPLLTFSLGRKVYVKHYPSSFIPDVVVHRAESRLGEQQYNLLSNNCEHFATWCKTGQNISQQVQDFVPSIGALGSTPPEGAPTLIGKALADVQSIQAKLQPQYDQVTREMDQWHQVALAALRQGREDLARAALERKQRLKPRVSSLNTYLAQLSDMTRTLRHNQVCLQGNPDLSRLK